MAMTQLNLLPDVKLEYLRASRQKRLVIASSLLLAVLSLGVVLMLVSVAYVFQKKSVNDLNSDIKTYTSQLQRIPDLNKVLTVQNQLNSLTALHKEKPAVTRVFDYLTQITPTAASITQYDVDFDNKTMNITGKASSLDVANTFIDTLKFTTYKVGDKSATGDGTKAFSNVVLSQFTRDADSATYTITLAFDAPIFDNSLDVNLSVPPIISTRSSTEQPTDLFQQATGAKQ